MLQNIIGDVRRTDSAKSRSRGYMMFEMFAVFVIAVVLSVVVFKAIAEAQRKSRDSKRLEDINAVSKAIAVYQADVGTAPPGEAVILGDENSRMLCQSGWAKSCPAGKTYLIGVPKGRGVQKGGCGESSDRYLYTQVNNGADFRIVFCLEGEINNLKGGIHSVTEAGVH